MVFIRYTGRFISETSKNIIQGVTEAVDKYMKVFEFFKNDRPHI